MNSFRYLINYLQEKIQEIEGQYNQEDLIRKKQKLEENIKFFSEDLESIDIELLYEIFEEYYNHDLVQLKIELFKEIVGFKNYLKTDNYEPQIKMCLDYLNEFKELFNKKLSEIQGKLNEYSNLVETNISLYNKFLSYFKDDMLKRVLINSELEELFSFLINSNIDKTIIFDIITLITLQNIELYEKSKDLEVDIRIKKIRENSKRVSKLVSMQSVSTKEESLESMLDLTDDELEEKHDVSNIELTDEEQNIYNEMLAICNRIKSENLEVTNELDILELLENDFSLSTLRKDIYNPHLSLGNIWLIILYDLENNLLPNFKHYKDDILSIFKYILKLFKENFISKQEFLVNLPLIKNKEEIEEYINEYNNLPDVYKNKLLSAKSIIQEFGQDALKTSNLDISNDEILYYSKIEELKKLYDLYQERIYEDIANDRSFAEVIVLEVNDLKTNILKLLGDIQELEEKFENLSGVEIEDNLQSDSYENLLLFLPNQGNSIHDTLIWQIEAMKKNYRDNHKEFLEQGFAVIEEKLLKFPFNKLKNISTMGGKRGKSKNKNGILENDGNKPKLDEYNVFRYKHKIGTGCRVIYMIIHLSDNNKLQLSNYYNLDSLNDICLVLNLDASIKDEKSYVKRAHDIVVQDETYIKHIIELFKNDFTKESFDEAISLIDESMAEFSTLKDTYYKKEEGISIGDSNDE